MDGLGTIGAVHTLRKRIDRMKTILVAVTFEAKVPDHVEPQDCKIQIVGTPEVSHRGHIVGQVVGFETVYSEHVEDY